jgi:outer membrane biosynthesis protein TonB
MEKGPIIGSVTVHSAAIFLAWWLAAVPPQVADFVTYEIELISPPAAEFGEQTTPPPPEDLVIETPFDPVPEPEEEIPPVTVEDDTPAEETPEPEVTAPPPDVEVVDDQRPVTSPDPAPDVETPGEDLNVRMEGLRRDYPAYYNNIIRQMDRCIRWRGDEDMQAKVYFVINRDGSVSGVDILEPSRSIAFDIQAMSAAECAGRPNSLGRLPEALGFDRLRVSFTITHQARRGSDSGQ